MYKHLGKRLLDLAFTIPALLLLAPALLLIALLVRFKLGAHVIFRQKRPGLHGKPFTMYKFRTMTEAHDAKGHLLPDEARLTPFGRLLRSAGLDELPELLNVLRGEMSLVGPRPLLMRYLEPHSLEQLRRHEVRPGIIGWAQVKRRNAIGWVEQFNLDAEYVDRCSLWLDLSIIALTTLGALARMRVSQPGHAGANDLQGR